MENKPQNVFERLDSIEVSQSATQVQNEEILWLLKNLSNNKQIQQKAEIKPQPQLSDQQVLRNFVKSSKKEHVWFGPIKEFNQSKAIVNILCVALIIVGVLSTIITSIAFKMYSTFSLFENIWLIFACIMFSYSINAKKRMLDNDLKEHSTYVFMQDADGTWRDINKEKKRFRWLRRISYIAVIANINVIWIQSSGGIAIAATIFEIAFAGLSIGLYFANVNLFCMYGNFILFTGKNLTTGKSVTLIFDVMGKNLAPYEEYKEKMKDYI